MPPSDLLSPDHLVSVPLAMSRSFSLLFPTSNTDWFVANDPVGSQLGSAGGTVYLLVEAWRNSGFVGSFTEWLSSSKKMIVHGGGRSRRLPAYAPCGKPFIPMPVTRTAFGERLDQKLIDFQVARFQRLLNTAPEESCVLVTSGDVLLNFDTPDIPLPQVDVLCFGMTEEAEIARDFGVFLTDSGGSGRFLKMLQKPSIEQIISEAATSSFLIDTGMWLLSERAVMALLAKCGWDQSKSSFARSGPNQYDLYGEFGLALGETPTVIDSAVSSLSCAVFALVNPSFLHLGTNRQLIESVSSLQAQAASKMKLTSPMRHPDIYIQNSHFDPPVRRAANTMIWVENSNVPSSWEIGREHVLTGIPSNDWAVKLDAGVSIDFVPIGETEFALRIYGFDDQWSGKIGNRDTLWLGRPAATWFSERFLSLERCGISANTDIHEAQIHPVLELDQIDGAFLEWIFRSHPIKSEVYQKRWLEARRISSQELNRDANLVRQMMSRRQNLREIVPVLQSNAQNSVFYRVDLEATALLLSHQIFPGATTPAIQKQEIVSNPLLMSKASMYEAALLRHLGDSSAAGVLETEAFSFLRDSLMSDSDLLVTPALDIQKDQIVWGRSPIRLDLAGGWTDTPPYCLQHGGRALNIAVDLNGQPPIQVYAKLSKKFEVVIRSIDLGVEQRLRTYEDLGSYAQPGSEFALAKAALALAGFHPDFYKGVAFDSLEAQLEAFGGGIEVSMLAAIPAGSGLGTSSILASTLLGTLSSLCRLNWSRGDIVQRALVLEQMLTTGGGWQDPVGGVYGGLKLCETGPGLKQNPVVRWLPDTLFSSSNANSRMLLYYTGITRLAKKILQDIVRGMFLNRSDTIACLDEIGNNVDRAANAIQLGDYPRLMLAVQRSWELNQRLDAGTNPPAVQAIFDRLAGEDVVGKLLGAGGGGFLFLLAADVATGVRVREKLEQNPLNPLARFVDISTSETGLAVTRS
jgi:galactokinase/mevalonate kinase-like predicted kinase